MLCDRCHSRESKILYTKFYEDEIHELHLCEECAEEEMKKDFKKNMVNDELSEVLEDITGAIAEALEDKEIKGKYCNSCNYHFEDFIDTGLVGCSDCYKSFEPELIKYLKANKNNLNYKGSMPKDIDKIKFIDKEIDSLYRKLEVSIELEEYEEAAILRDKIKVLEEKIK